MKHFTFLLLMMTVGLGIMAQSQSNFIVVDQFGYLPDAPKKAVIKNPQFGFDGGESFSPGATYEVVDAETGTSVFSGSPQMWNGGNTDASSGDKVWWFDFSSVSETGDYFVYDVNNDVRSFEFHISPSVYNEVLKQAVRTFFYQRSGFAKEEPYAEAGWTDEASHVGPLQDTEARLFSEPNNPATARDVSGGWYDAGDYNKYTSWTANYVIEMMYAFQENPDVWTDDFNIPESGNGIPDLLDEAKWGIDHLVRMQNDDGGVLSVVGVAHASPPSSASGPSLYGPASTSATHTAAAAFAIASTVYESIGMTEYANELKIKAVEAWNWADVNTDVLFKNNDAEYNSQGLAAGQQEVDDYGRLTMKIMAACFLFELTGEVVYRDFVDDNYQDVNLMGWNFAYPFESGSQNMLLYYTSLDDATGTVVEDIKSTYGNSMMNGEENYPTITGEKDPYMAHIKDYTWGSNNIKSIKANMFLNVSRFGAGSITRDEAGEIALGYVNYLHGVNPLNFVYLSNMFKYGAENGVREFYHTWFHDGSNLWDRAGVSTYGPAPGFVTGGANPSYDWDGCCPDGCGSTANNQACYDEDVVPPKNQPDQKSYNDFNNSWPLNSWSVTENSCGYQLSYIRLLANYVDFTYDCNGDLNGDAVIDVCGACAGGNTGREPVSDSGNCEANAINGAGNDSLGIALWPNPVSDKLFISMPDGLESYAIAIDLNGVVKYESFVMGNTSLDVTSFSPGVYFMVFETNTGSQTNKFVVDLFE
jgi:endoglucanase